MTDSAVAVTAGSGTNIDTRTQPDGDHRQVMVVGDPTATTTASVTAAGALRAQPYSTTATRSQVVASSTVEQQLLAANTARVGFTLYNNSTATLYLGLGTATAGAADCSIFVAAGTYYESPFGFTGAVRGLWSATNGAAYLTELT